MATPARLMFIPFQAPTRVSRRAPGAHAGSGRALLRGLAFAVPLSLLAWSALLVPIAIVVSR